MFKRNKNWKILKKTIIKKLGRKRNSKAKMRTKFILKIQGKTTFRNNDNQHSHKRIQKRKQPKWLYT